MASTFLKILPNHVKMNPNIFQKSRKNFILLGTTVVTRNTIQQEHLKYWAPFKIQSSPGDLELKICAAPLWAVVPCNLIVDSEVSEKCAGSMYREGLKSMETICLPNVSTKLLTKDYVVYAH